MKTEIVAVGTELLTPFFQDTNSLYLTQRLNDIGLAVSFKTLVGDEADDLGTVLATALQRSSLIFLMGGLGPTEDDRTRETLAAVLGRRLVFKKDILDRIRERFRRRGLSMPSSNRKQGFIIEGAEVLDNPNGTAAGLWVETPSSRIAVLPGPPAELKPMFENHVLPRLASLSRGRTVRRTIRLTGIGESFMEGRIRDLYPDLPPGLTLTTLASPGDLAIHLSCREAGPAGSAAAGLDRVERRLVGRLRPWIYSRGGESLESVVGSLLSDRGETVACAESCTGGLLGHRLTDIPGSSAYFLESAVVYGNTAKRRRLGLPVSLIERHGAVSAPVARAMAAGIRRTAGSDYGLAVTGIAGPGGGTARKPVGLVYIALDDGRSVTVTKNVFLGGRDRIKFQSTQKALDLLRKRLIMRSGKAYNRKAGRP